MQASCLPGSIADSLGGCLGIGNLFSKMLLGSCKSKQYVTGANPEDQSSNPWESVCQNMTLSAVAIHPKHLLWKKCSLPSMEKRSVP